MKLRIYCILSILVLLAPTLVLAAGPAGTITHVEGAVEVIRSGKSLWAQPNMALLVQDTLKTGQESYAGIRFTDGSTLAMAPETEITVADYTVTENSQKSVIEMAIGFMHCRVRKMGAGFFGLKKNRWEVHTDTAVVGVRGTDLWTLVGEEAGPTKEKPTECLVEDGEGYGHPKSLDWDSAYMAIKPGWSFKAPSASQPGSVGPPSDEMLGNVEILSGKFLSEPDAALFDTPSDAKTSGAKKSEPSDKPIRHPKGLPIAQDVKIEKGDVKTCDKEVAKAKDAIKKWNDYINGLEENFIETGWGLLGEAAKSPDTQAHPNSPLSRFNRLRDELDSAREERDRWKEQLRQLQAICRKMRQSNISAGGNGGGGSGGGGGGSH